MSDELPDPLTDPDCDLRDYTWMPIDVSRLLTSETWMLGTAEQKVAAMTLWLKAWHQMPAASLPDNPKMLALLSEAGAAWPKISAHVLRGWVKCSDGRLYHPVVAEKAKESWALKVAQKARTEAARAAKAAKKASLSGDPPPSVTEPFTEPVTTNVTRLVTTTATETVTDSVTEVVTGSTRPDQTKERKKEPFATLTAPAEPSPPDQPCPNARTKLFRNGLANLLNLTGKPERAARSLLGNWLKSLGDDAAALNAILDAAVDLRPADPVPWIVAAVQNRRQPRLGAVEQARSDWDLGTLASPEARAAVEELFAERSPGAIH